MSRDYARLIEMADGSIGFESSYDPGLVAALKAQIPYTDRRWDPSEKLWRVAKSHAKTLQLLSAQYLGVKAELQGNLFKADIPQIVTKLVKLEYLGAAKNRGADEPIAYGYCNGDWSLMFALSVLKSWFSFDDISKPDEAPSLYSVIGAKRGASGSEIKTAYRRAARTWHPDVCQEPDAKEQFQRILEAYEILSDPLKRKRYEAGLALAASVSNNHQQGVIQSGNVWKPPLRCGWLLVEAESVLGRLNISRILKWEDITDSQGRTLVTFWKYGNDMFSTRWV